MTRRKTALARVASFAALCAASAASPRIAAAKTLFDYFQPVPIIDKLTSTGWGASNVQPRDQDNGLEDKTMKSWSYWDGRIVKAANGNFHLFASRWDQSQGHWNGWPNSVCVHAVSEASGLGPYVDKGPCYTDANGKGHNVMAGHLADGSYFILASETRRPAPVYSSKSLDGPWTALGGISVTGNGFPTDNTSSNTTFWPNPDGSILATSRDGIMMVSTNGLTGPYVLKTNSVYANISHTSSGTPEDPCLWYSGGQYHMVYSYPLDRKMYHLTSADGISNWKNMGLAVDATKPFIRYADGTVNIWNKLERPQVYLENGHVKYFTFAAIDVDKGNDLGNDNHGSKIIVVPFDGELFDAETGIGGGDAGADGGGDAGGSQGSGGRGAGGAGGASGGAVASGGASNRGGADAGKAGSSPGGGGPSADAGPGAAGSAIASAGGSSGSAGHSAAGADGSLGSGGGGVGGTSRGNGSGGSTDTSSSPGSDSGCTCSMRGIGRGATRGSLLLLGLLALRIRRRRRWWIGRSPCSDAGRAGRCSALLRYPQPPPRVARDKR